jgi:hypothetical protein
MFIGSVFSAPHAQDKAKCLNTLPRDHHMSVLILMCHVFAQESTVEVILCKYSRHSCMLTAAAELHHN